MKTELCKDLESCLLEVRELLRASDSDFRFVKHFKTWLQTCEETLDRHKQPDTAKVAAIHGLLLAAESGVYDQRFLIDKRLTRRKKLKNIALHYLSETQQVISAVHDPIQDLLDKSESIIREALLLAFESGLLKDYVDEIAHIDPDRVHLWKVLAGTPRTAQVRQILTFFSFAEAIILLKKVWEKWEEEVLHLNGRKRLSEKR